MEGNKLLEQLFLLEVVIDKLALRNRCDPSAKCICVLPAYNEDLPIRIRVKFINFPCFEIEQEHFSKEVDDMKGMTIVKNFSSGKSCLFPMAPLDLARSIQLYPLAVTVYQRSSEYSQAQVIGVSRVPLSNEMVEAVRKASSCQEELPINTNLLGSFPLTGPGGKDAGRVQIFVRLSCFGQSIVTQFQLVDEFQSFLFKNSRADTAFQCKRCVGRIDIPCPVYKDILPLRAMVSDGLEDKEIKDVAYAPIPFDPKALADLCECDVLREEKWPPPAKVPPEVDAEEPFCRGCALRIENPPPCDKLKFLATLDVKAQEIEQGRFEVEKCGDCALVVRQTCKECCQQAQAMAATAPQKIREDKCCQALPAGQQGAPVGLVGGPCPGTPGLHVVSPMPEDKPLASGDVGKQYMEGGKQHDMGRSPYPDSGRMDNIECGKSPCADMQGGRQPHPDSGRTQYQDSGRPQHPDSGRTQYQDSGRPQYQEGGGRPPFQEARDVHTFLEGGGQGYRPNREGGGAGMAVEQTYMQVSTRGETHMATQIVQQVTKTQHAILSQNVPLIGDAAFTTPVETEGTMGICCLSTDPCRDIDMYPKEEEFYDDLEEYDGEYGGYYYQDAISSAMRIGKDIFFDEPIISHNPPIRYDTTGKLSDAWGYCDRMCPIVHPPIRYDTTSSLTNAFQDRNRYAWPANPLVRYDTTSILSPAFGGAEPPVAVMEKNPPIRYDTTGCLSSYCNHPPVRYDTTGCLSPAYEEDLFEEGIDGLGGEKQGPESVHLMDFKPLMSYNIGPDFSLLELKDLLKKPKRRPKPKKRKPLRPCRPIPCQFPTVRRGHKRCLDVQFRVPSRMGWLWNTSIPGLPYRPGWRPGAITAAVSRRIQTFHREYGQELQEMWIKKKAQRTGEEPGMREVPPTLVLSRCRGKFHLSVRPLPEEINATSEFAMPRGQHFARSRSAEARAADLRPYSVDLSVSSTTSTTCTTCTSRSYSVCGYSRPSSATSLTSGSSYDSVCPPCVCDPSSSADTDSLKIEFVAPANFQPRWKFPTLQHEECLVDEKELEPLTKDEGAKGKKAKGKGKKGKKGGKKGKKKKKK